MRSRIFDWSSEKTLPLFQNPVFKLPMSVISPPHTKKKLWQSSPASNPEYALIYANDYKIPKYGQTRFMLQRWKQVAGEVLVFS
jgi:hypothetical protein